MIISIMNYPPKSFVQVRVPIRNGLDISDRSKLSLL
jgi:hypothetical protein